MGRKDVAQLPPAKRAAGAFGVQSLNSGTQKVHCRCEKESKLQSRPDPLGSEAASINLEPMSNSRRLADRLALVTGATRGIGRAVALAYAREGAHLILVGRTAGALEEVDDEIRAIGGSATLLTLDLKSHDKIDALGPTIYQRWNKLDILVGNAGILGPLSPLGHVSADAWNEVIEINLTANWRLIRTLDPLLRRRTRHLRLVRCGEHAARLLGSLRRLQGRVGGAREGLCRGGRQHACARQSPQSGPDPLGHARQGVSRGGPGLPQAARAHGGHLHQAGTALLNRQWQVVRLADWRRAVGERRRSPPRSPRHQTSTTMPSYAGSTWAGSWRRSAS